MQLSLYSFTKVSVDGVMGSECSVEKDYELEEPVECSSKEWRLIAARRKQDDLKATVFIYEKNRKEKPKKEERIAKAAQVIIATYSLTSGLTLFRFFRKYKLSLSLFCI